MLGHDKVKGEHAFTAGLLHDIGLLAIIEVGEEHDMYDGWPLGEALLRRNRKTNRDGTLFRSAVAVTGPGCNTDTA
jgi:hypothetical protein